MILAILFAYLGYKRANSAGRNGILWAFIAAGVFILTQVIIGLFVGIVIGVGSELYGWSEDFSSGSNVLFTVITVAISAGAGYVALRFADRPLKEEAPLNSPPPPPDFSEDNRK